MYIIIRKKKRNNCVIIIYLYELNMNRFKSTHIKRGIHVFFFTILSFSYKRYTTFVLYASGLTSILSRIKTKSCVTSFQLLPTTSACKFAVSRINSLVCPLSEHRNRIPSTAAQRIHYRLARFYFGRYSRQM